MTNRDKLNEYQRRYRASDKGRKAAKREANSIAFKLAQERWLSKSANKKTHQAATKRWRESEGGRKKEISRTTSEEYKAKQRAYRLTELGKAAESRRKNSPKYRYTLYQKNAEARGYLFNITMDDFMLFWQKPCQYCGDPISTIGLDRVDNSSGYSVSNVVPCCRVCNRSKDIMSREEYIAHCAKVVSRSQRP